MTRDLEKDKVLSSHKTEKFSKSKEQTVRELEQIDFKIKELTDKILYLEAEKRLNLECSKEESANNELQKKILNLDKEISLAQGKIKEAEFLMETRRKERANESMLKRSLQDKITMITVQIDEARVMNERIIEEKVREKQEVELKAKETEIGKQADRIRNTQHRIDMEEQEIQKIVDDKVPLQQDIIEQEHNKEKFEKDLANLKKTVHDLKTQRDLLEDKNKQQAVQFEPLQKSEAKYKDTAVALELGIKTNKERLAQFEKQVASSDPDRIREAHQGPQLQ
jgi:chromosome segregation ATPase